MKISTWDGVINSRDQRFYKFIEGNKDKIIRITGAAEKSAARYDRQSKQCVIGHTQSDGTGTEYLIDCSWWNGEWRVNGFFTQQEWLFRRGVMSIPLQGAVDAVVLSQDPVLIPFKPSKR